MERNNIHLPEVKRMYDATLLQVLPDYGFGGGKLSHAVVTEGGSTLRMSGYPSISEKGVVGKGDMGVQTAKALELVRLTVEQAGGTWDDVVHTVFYFTDRKQYHQKAFPARWEFFRKHSKSGNPPCATAIGVKELMHPDFLIEVEATAVFGKGTGDKMQRTNIHIPEVKKMYDATLLEILPDYGWYGSAKITHAVVTQGGRTLRMSGYPAISENGVVGKGDMGVQMTQALELVKRTVEAAGGTWEDIVHTLFYFTDRKQFHEKALPARAEFFKKYSKTGIAPCSTGVGVPELMHPDFMIEVEATAVF